MLHENDFGSQQHGRPNILNNVAIVTGENSALPAFDLEDNIFVSRKEIRIDKRAELSELCFQTRLVYADMPLVQVASVVLLE